MHGGGWPNSSTSLVQLHKVLDSISDADAFFAEANATENRSFTLSSFWAYLGGKCVRRGIPSLPRPRRMIPEPHLKRRLIALSTPCMVGRPSPLLSVGCSASFSYNSQLFRFLHFPFLLEEQAPASQKYPEQESGL